MDFKKQTTPQTLGLNNLTSAQAITLYLKDHTFMDWNKMMEIWFHGYTYTKYNQSWTIKPEPRINGGSLYPGIGLVGGHGSPTNYVTTIQYLIDHGYITFTHINGFKLLASTKKTKHLQFNGSIKVNQ
jgi:hypothetical protein